MSILKTGSQLKHIGKSTGTMFGYGVYMAECASKSDEYARDDGGGTVLVSGRSSFVAAS